MPVQRHQGGTTWRIAREIVEDLTAALAEFEAVAAVLESAAFDGGSETPGAAD